MDNSVSKQILLVIIGIALAIIAIAGVSYAITIGDNSSKKVRVITDNSDTGIVMSNTLPISDREGILSSNVLDFCTLAMVEKNSSVRYEVALDKVMADNHLNDSDVKIYLEKLNSNNYIATDITKIPTEFIANNDSNTLTPVGSMILYYGIFSNDSSNDKEMSECFRLRMWIDEDTVISSSPREFKTMVNIYS